MKRIFFILSLLCFGATADAQTASAYTFVALPSPFTSIAATGTPVPSLSADNFTQAGIPIGFTFTYCGTPYMTLSASSNGWVSLTESPSTSFSNTTGAIDGPGWIMPFWDDLDGSTGTAYYETSGTAPLRIFTFEWHNFSTASGTGIGSFQVKFYENFNLIDFHYGPTTITGMDATIGISNDNVSDWQTLSDASPAPTVLASPAFETAVPNAPADGILYRWTPSSCPVAPITGATSICTGGFALVSSATAGCTWSSSTPGIATITAGTGTITGISPGTTTISYISPLGCYATRVFTVTATPPITGTLSLCTGVPVTYTHPTPGGTWTSSVASVATVVPTTGVVTGISAGTSRITYIMPGGCKSSVMITVNVSPAPITGTFVICQGVTTTLSTTSTGGIWSSSFSSIASIDAAGNMTGAGGGVADISYTMPSGCASIAPVTVNPLPAAITGGTSLCIFGTLPLSSTTSGGTWTSSAPGVASVDAVTGLVTAGAGAGTAEISYTLASGCFVTTTVNVVVVVAPVIGPATACMLQTATYTNASAGGIWSSSTPATGTITSAGGVFTPIAVGTTNLTYTLGSGCFTTFAVTVAANAPISGISSFCVGEFITMSNPIAPTTWGLSSGSPLGIATGGSTATVWGSSAGTGTVSYTNINGCVSTLAVTVHPVPSAITGTLLVCAGNTSTLSSLPTGGTWTSSNSAVGTIDASSGTAAAIASGTSGITYTTTLGCIATAVLSVSPVPAAMTGILVVCPTYTSLLSHAIPGGTWSSSDASMASVGASSGILTGVNTAGGTATITYLPPATGCVTTSVATVLPAPAITVPGGASLCVGDNKTFNSSIPGSTWASSNVSVATVVSGSGVVTGAGSGTATITCFGSNGCTSTIIVTVNANPTAITGTAVVCVNATTTLSSGPGGGVWGSSNTGIATVAGGVVTGVGANTVTISYTLGTGCFRTTTVTVNAIPSPIGGTASVCVGLTTTLNSSAGGTWSSSNTTVATIGTSSGIATGNLAGTSNISYILPTGCFRIRILTVNALPAAISGPTAVCPGTSATLTNSSPGGTWSSSVPAVGSIIAGTGVVTGVATGTTQIIYTLPTSCISTTTVTVMAAPIAAITPIGDTILCPGDFVTLTSSAMAGVTYEWYNGGILIPGAVTATHIASTAGSYQVRLTVSAGCTTLSSPMSVTVVPATATITVPGSTTTCAGTPVTLNANTGTGLTYQWSLAGTAIPGATGSTHSALTSGNYTVRVTNSAGCWAISTPVAITVLPAPSNVVTASGPLTFCNGGNVVLTAATGAGYTYQWHNASGVIPGATANSYTATTAGSYHIVITDPSGCTTTTTPGVVAVNPLPNVAITPSGPRIFCVGGIVALTAAPGFSYQWYRDGAAISGAISGAYIADISGGYRVRVTNTTTGCTDITHADTVVSVVSSPAIVPLTPAKFCWGGSSLLSTSVSGLGNAINYQWSFNSVVIPGATNSTYNASVAGVYVCTITVPSSCTVVTGPISVMQVPLPDPPISFNGTSIKTGNYYVAYQWYKNLVAIPGATSFSTPSTGPGTYKVAVTDTNGCQSVSANYVLNSTPPPPTGVANVNSTEIRIFPNPAQRTVYIACEQQVHTKISGMDGRTLIDQRDVKEIDISNLANGMYVIAVYDIDNNLLKTEKLVKRSE